METFYTVLITLSVYLSIEAVTLYALYKRRAQLRPLVLKFMGLRFVNGKRSLLLANDPSNDGSNGNCCS